MSLATDILNQRITQQQEELNGYNLQEGDRIFVASSSATLVAEKGGDVLRVDFSSNGVVAVVKYFDGTSFVKYPVCEIEGIPGSPAPIHPDSIICKL